jgi:uncharacterized protein (TIGR02231 family)
MIAIETTIRSVTVYTDRARVTRHGRGRAPAGLQALYVDGLPEGLLSESVRASARATSPARLLGTEVTRQFHAAPPEDRAAALEAEVEALQERDEAIGKEQDALTVRRAFLGTLGAAAGEQIARGIAFGRTGVETAASVDAYLAEQLAAIDAAAQDAVRRRRQLQRELAAARCRLESRRSARRAESKRIAILVELEAEGDVEVEVTYQVPGASWEPLYDLRLEETAGGASLKLVYQAQVTQRTGEAWSGVALTLSTARPALGTIPPELQPWFLYDGAVFDPAHTRAGGVGGGGAARPRMAVMAAAAAEEPLYDAEALAWSDVPVAVAEPESGPGEPGAAVSFHVPGSPDIPSDGSPHKVTLAGHEFPAALDYVTAPKLVAQAYRRARITNTSRALLLPGSAAIFLGDEFIGSTALRTVAPGQEWEVFLGVDDRIQVERKLVAGSVDKKLLADVRRMSYAYEIRLTNLKEHPVKVTVLDQVPVSRNEAVKVRTTELRPTTAAEPELGRLKWEMELPPGEEKSVRFGFTVEAARHVTLHGLPDLG